MSDEALDPFDENAVPPDGAAFNASHRGSIRKRTQKQKVAEERRAAMLGHILDNEHGRAWLAWVMHDVCGMYSPTENAAFDTNGLHFREGGRAVALMLQEAALAASPDNYILMLKENLKPKAPTP